MKAYWTFSNPGKNKWRMNFVTDKQTLDDLNIPGRYRPDSVFSLFNKVVTRGGERWLDHLFQHPLCDAAAINERAATFRYFADIDLQFPFSRGQFQVMEEYLGGRGSGNIVSGLLDVYKKKLLELTVRDESYKTLHEQLVTTISLLNDFAAFLNRLVIQDSRNHFLRQLQNARKLFDSGAFHWLRSLQGVKQFSAAKLAKYDHRLRTVHAAEVTGLLETIYQLDVYIAVSAVARQKSFAYANALPKEKKLLAALNLRHPCLENAIGNDIAMDEAGNLIFLTGANMAGKSTFMKSFGIAFYLAHMGFPVAANDMSFSVKDGLYTSINVPDNLSLGYSHFYAEVLRVKKVAQEIMKPQELVVIFDELFKGTNVKDAYDATLAITSAFAEKQHCFFIISTHITEAGTSLQQQSRNLQFLYFPSLLNGSMPVYTYKLQQGISDDRHGMVIIRKERILDL
jgi:DNA mismatch repair protein MutS